MKRILSLSLLVASLAAAPCGVSQAEVRPPPKRQDSSEGSSDRFGDAVDLSRFRKGNYEWDTQALIVSGLTALHEEQLRILHQLNQIQSRLDRLDRRAGSSEGRGDGSGS